MNFRKINVFLTRYDPEFPASGFLFCRETLIYDYELAFDLSQTDRSLEPGDEIPGLFFRLLFP
jgi:hypothetical protein